MKLKNRILFPGYSAFHPCLSIEDFTRIAETAREAGFTHVDLGCAMTGRSRYQLDNDGNWCEGYDFYPEYTAVFPAFFKFHVPEKFRAYLPQSYAAANLERFRAFAEILRKLGLKGSLICSEALFLPEKAFADHPQWRGPRCDFGARSRKGYFAPCVDNPEIQECYREASSVLGEAAPVMDYIEVVTGDSGAGLCWGKLYPGPNGPESCRTIPLEERERAFLSVLKSGFPGVSMIFLTEQPNWTYTGILPYKSALGKGSTYLLRVPQDKPLFLENPVTVLDGLAKAVDAGAEWLRFSIEDPQGLFRKESIYPALFQHFETLWSPNRTERISRLAELLRKLEKNTDASALCDAWTRADEALRTLGGCFLNSILFYGSMSERWLTRPLLAMPERVPFEEKAYYLRHVFNVLGAEAENDLLDYHGARWSNIALDASAATRSEQSLAYIVSLLDDAVTSMERSGTAPRRLARLRACRCFVRNIRNILSFQAEMDRARMEVPRAKYEKMTGAVREEFSNTLELAEILEEFPEILARAESAADENTFLFGPDIVAQLHRKNRLMCAHIHDIDDLTYNRRNYIDNML